VLSWQDILHEGPVQAGTRQELLRARARFLSGCGWGGEAALRSSLERRDRRFLDALRDGACVVLWFEHDLYDQLQLIDALTLARSVEAAPELIVIGAFPGKPSFAGLGELTADELETLWPSRTRATPEGLEAAAEAWAALCEPEPAALAELAERDNAQLPFLAPALRRLLAELPASAACRKRRDSRSRRSRPVPGLPPQLSSRRNAASMRRSSATRGSSARCRRWGKERTGWSRATAPRSRLLHRSATASRSCGSSCA
jgi:hypothetical protein